MRIYIRNRLMNRLLNRLKIHWKVVLTTLEDDTYFKAKGKLVSAGIVHKTKVIPIDSSSSSISLTRSYEIKVKEEDANKAYEIIHY